ncbi:MAG TPA: signal peptidase I [Solirubrobacteraceae bacterium]|nr:signal peptidase I [Solirubrobacteraceae bacterium]
MLALAIVGCGGSSHTASSAVANANGAAGAAAGADGTGTATGGAGTGTTGAATGSAQSGTTSTSSGQGHGNGAGAPATSGGAVKNGPNDPAGSGGAGGSSTSSGKPSAHSKPKAAGGAGGHAGAAGSGSSGTGSAGGGSGANPNSGVPFEVTTGSMEPTFQPETKIYYDPTRTHPQIGEVVVFYLPSGAEEGACGEAMIGGRPCRDPVAGKTQSNLTSFKRVVGLPGDSIAIRAGHVIRNGQSEPEPPTLPCEKVEHTACEYPTAITVPAGHYYLMADNRGLQKEDSRIFGAVPQEYLLGTVVGH